MPCHVEGLDGLSGSRMRVFNFATPLLRSLFKVCTLYLAGKTEREIEEKIGIDQKTFNRQIENYLSHPDQLTEMTQILFSTSQDEETQGKPTSYNDHSATF
jgi:hypothetical protein